MNDMGKSKTPVKTMFITFTEHPAEYSIAMRHGPGDEWEMLNSVLTKREEEFDFSVTKSKAWYVKTIKSFSFFFCPISIVFAYLSNKQYIYSYFRKLVLKEILNLISNRKF